MPDLNLLERLSYMHWDAVFLCFDITDKISMFTVLQWVRFALTFSRDSIARLADPTRLSSGSTSPTKASPKTSHMRLSSTS